MFLKFIPNEESMLAFAAQFATFISRAAIIFLYGELGAGKTTFSRGFLRGLGFTGVVKSPTYTIVEPYETKSCTVFHFDFYRIHNLLELEFIGLKDYFSPNSICLIEWPERAGALLPPADLSCYIETSLEGRNMKMIAQSPRGEAILKKFMESQKE